MYYEARYYDSVVGQFVSVDPILNDIKSAWLADSQKFNPYAYTQNNPLKYIDPTGKSIEISRYLEDGQIVYKMFVKFAVVNDTSKFMSRSEMGRIRLRMSRAIRKAFTKKFASGARIEAHVLPKNVDYDTALNLKLKQKYHVVHLFDKLKGLGPNVIGKGPFGKLSVFINRKMLSTPELGPYGSIEKTIPHEFGHSATLRHPSSSQGDVEFDALLDLDNLMYQTQKEPQGISITESQAEQMYNAFQRGELNTMSNKERFKTQLTLLGRKIKRLFKK